MTGIKELKNRIKSIGSTRKITRAMQMVSASKMRKSQNAVVNSRSYASLAWEMISSVIPAQGGIQKGERWIPDRASLVRDDKAGEVGMTRGKTGVILLTSNRGLVGSLNTNLMNVARPFIGNQKADESARYSEQETIAEIVTYGKKGQIIAARLKKNIVADFPKFDRTISIEEIYPIAKFVSDAYDTDRYQKIVIVYNHFVSTLSQKATVKQILPFAEARNLTPSLSDIGEGGRRPSEVKRSDKQNYLFEPSPRSVISHLIPRIIESQIYQAILESDASEHSARMVMMKNATEAAGDLISDLTLTYNQLRQGKITTELAEITAGRIALE